MGGNLSSYCITVLSIDPGELRCRKYIMNLICGQILATKDGMQEVAPDGPEPFDLNVMKFNVV